MTNLLTIHHASKLGVFRHLPSIVHSLSNMHTAITFDDAKALWHIHKKNSKCTGCKWSLLSRKQGKISGLECGCGFKYTQKRPIIFNRTKNNRLSHRNPPFFSVASY